MSFVKAVTTVVQADQSKKQGKRMENAANYSNLTQSQQYQQQRDDLEPWRQAGGNALGDLMAGFGHKAPELGENYGLNDQEIQLANNYKMLLEKSPAANDKNSYFAKTWGAELEKLTKKSEEAKRLATPTTTTEENYFNKDFSMADFEKDPGYAFRLAEGQKALERSAAARGGRNSGGTMKALQAHGQGMASEEYANAFNRYNANRDSRYNRLANLAGMGQVATQQVGQAGQNYANQYSNNLMGGANARAAGSIAGTNAFTNFAKETEENAAKAAGFVYCDERLKENISDVSPEDFAELAEAIKPKMFTYKNGEHGVGQFVGPMAQDIEHTKLGKTLVYENSQGQKVLDQEKVLMLLLAQLGSKKSCH